jgi:hypothetical protein
MKKKIAMERLPVFEMVVNDDEVTGIDFVSIVENPAIGIKGHIFKRRKWQKRKGEIKRGQSDAVGYEPPCHDNCLCYINDGGEWITEPDACAFCKNNQAYYNDTVRFSNENIEINDFLFSVDMDKQIIAGPAMVPDIDIFRTDESGDYYVRFSKETIEKSVEKFTRDNTNKAIDVEHSHNMVKAFIMEHWIVRDSVFDASNSYGFKNLPVGTWFVVLKIDDKEFWDEQVKGENKQSFSIEIKAGLKRVRLSETIDIETVLDTLSEDEIIEIMKYGIKK